jgi:gamma-glutamyltranspeptidase / glutathione hydrolase
MSGTGSTSDRSFALLAESVSARGRRVVSAGAAVASAAGVAMFDRGGNAFDAAVAAALVEGVVLPMKCGLAGDVVALVREAGGAFKALISVGPGAGALARGVRMTVTGPRSVGIPGAPHGYAALAAKGRLDREVLVKPAMRLAADGFPWERIAVELTVGAQAILRENNSSTVFLPNSRLPRPGEQLRLPQLLPLLTDFADDGERLFFGRHGAAVAKRVTDAGGFLAAEDLCVKPAIWSDLDAHHLSTVDATLLVTPRPTHGASLARAVAIAIDGADLVEAVRESRSKNSARAAAGTGTSVVTAADADGNAVVLVHSNSFQHYGSGVVVEELGLVLNNRPGRGFDLAAPPDAPNAPAAGRTPVVTLHAWALERDGRVFAGATPGGANQMPWNLQTVAELLVGRTPADVVLAPRFGLGGDNKLICERNHPFASRAEASVVPELSLGSVTQILTLQDDSREAAADPRTGARACAAP